MSRSKWKNCIVKNCTYKSFVFRNKKIEARTIERATRLVKDFEGKTFLVENGLKNSYLTIKREMLGFYCGDFVLTRKFRSKK